MQTHSLQDISETVSFLRKLYLEKISHINEILHTNIELDMIIFFGDCSFDSHGMLIDDNPYVFFDLNAVIPRIHTYNFNVFMVHETLHAIHYHLNPEFYRGNYCTVEEKYLKLLFAEGIATHVSYIISKESLENAYWLGYLEENRVRDWVSNCEKMRIDIGNNIYQSIATGNLDKSLYHQLFGIENLEKITSYRIGYYYGAEIVRECLENRSIYEVLTLRYDEVRKVIYKYFAKK